VVFSESQGLLLALGLFWDKKKSILGRPAALRRPALRGRGGAPQFPEKSPAIMFIELNILNLYQSKGVS
jgi:hypothetical protein